jgi:hypothetical protein
MLPKTSAANSRGCGESRRSGKTAAGWESVQGTAKRKVSCHHQPPPPPGEKIRDRSARHQTSPAVGRRGRLIENPIVVKLYKSMTTSRIGCERDHAAHVAALRSKRRESQPPSLLKSSSFPVAEFGNLAKSTDPKSLSAKKSLCSVPPIQRQLPLTYL